VTDAIVVALGAALVVAVLFDVLTTTLTLGEGAGPLTRRVLGWLWRGALRLRPRGSRSRVLSNAGPTLLVQRFDRVRGGRYPRFGLGCRLLRRFRRLHPGRRGTSSPTPRSGG
jgi:hypothetical protein